VRVPASVASASTTYATRARRCSTTRG
jgi:hypothetical protein